MRAGLLRKEPELQGKWDAQELYAQIRAERNGARRFVLHDGPPYANGNIHMGTALNKVLKDMVVRVHNMLGHDAPYVPGWDCHGLPIEHKVMTDLGGKAAALTPLEIRQKCRDYAQKFVELQAQQFKRLGVLGRFEDPYLTMSPSFEAASLEVFARLVERGYVYRELKPVHWSIENQTALAEAELEYQDRNDPSVYVFFDVSDGVLEGVDGSLSLLIWTTTPWTLPSNRAVAVHPDLTYQVLQGKGTQGTRVFLTAEGLASEVIKVLTGGGGCFDSVTKLSELKGRDVVDAKLKYRYPLADGEGIVVPAEYVTLEQGTGLVHTAPGHGADDFYTGRKFDLETYCPVLPNGKFDHTVPEFEGMSVWEANPKIVARLESKGHLGASEVILHSYPHDWRSKGATIFRATEQWFVAVDGKGTSETALREAALGATEEEQGSVRFVPEWGRARMRGMLEARPDWCISRQRSWGLPIPVFFDGEGRTLLTPSSVRAVAAAFAKSGSDLWYSGNVEALLEGYDPSKDPDLADASSWNLADLTPGKDIFDVWFESGSSWFAVAIAEGLVEDVPVDLYLEGSDQHRGWFQLSLLTALGAAGKAPFADLVTHGFIVTEDGLKMSKSLGNTIEVTDQLKNRGADILRLWLTTQDFHTDIRCSEALIGQAEDAYRKIRNTLRFMMGSCGDFDPKIHGTAPEDGSLDAWFNDQVTTLTAEVIQDYRRYSFYRGVRKIYEFCTVQASAVYLNAVKDRLYCDPVDAPRRRRAQTVIHRGLTELVRLLAPVVPHTAEEAWANISGRPGNENESVHLALFPESGQAAPPAEGGSLTEFDGSQSPAWVWARLLELREDGLKKLEELRAGGVKSALDAEAVFHIAEDAPEVQVLLKTHLPDLEDLLGVGFARIAEGLPGAPVNVEVLDSRERYARCARSWKRRPDVGSDSEYPDISVRDAEAVRVGKAAANQ